MATFRFAVSGQYLDLLTPTRGIADGLNVNSFTFDFRSSEWADCTDKWLHLYNPDYNGDDSTYDLVIIEDEIPADRGVNLPSGIWEVFVHGNVVLNGEVIQRYVTETQSIQIVPSGIFDNAPIGEVAPSVAEQLSAMVREAYNDRITTATATVDNEFGTPAVMVSTSGEEGYKSINFDFHNLKGNGIASVVFISSGDNQGRIIVTLTDGTESTFDGVADALDYIYEHSDEIVEAAIQEYLLEHIDNIVPDGSITYAKLADGLVSTATMPQMDGVASQGIEQAYSRADHVHPTSSLASLGLGYATCGTAESTTAKEVTLSGYSLVEGAMPTIKFTYAVPASSKLNINGTGSKSIYISYGGMLTAVPAGLIKAGDTVTFVYNGSQYVVQSIFSQVRAVNKFGNITSLSIEEVSS